MADPYQSDPNLVVTPAKRWANVTPNDGVDLPGGVPKSLWVNGAGNLELVGDDGNSLNFTVAAAGPVDLRPTRVKATGTTATGIRALY
jgi:hypothetical protein